MSLSPTSGSMAAIAREVPSGPAELVGPVACSSRGRSGWAVTSVLEPVGLMPSDRYRSRYRPPLEHLGCRYMMRHNWSTCFV
jgi:hypothetical protein